MGGKLDIPTKIEGKTGMHESSNSSLPPPPFTESATLFNGRISSYISRQKCKTCSTLFPVYIDIQSIVHLMTLRYNNGSGL